MAALSHQIAAEVTSKRAFVHRQIGDAMELLLDSCLLSMNLWKTVFISKTESFEKRRERDREGRNIHAYAAKYHRDCNLLALYRFRMES